MTNEKNLRIYTGHQDGCCVDVAEITFKGFSVVSDSELAKLKACRDLIFNFGDDLYKMAEKEVTESVKADLVTPTNNFIDGCMEIYRKAKGI